MSTIIEGDALTTGGNMTNLKPYTTYRVSVSVLTKNGEGQKSEPRFTTTLEDGKYFDNMNYNYTNSEAD